MNLIIGAILAATASAVTLKLDWSDCGGGSTHAPITGFTPATLETGTTTTMTGTGNLDEDVPSATFDLEIKTALTTVSCKGDASVSKTCSLPLGTGSLTFEALTFPIKKGPIPVSVSIKLSAALPGALAHTDTKVTATGANGDKLFCIEIKTAPALEVHPEIAEIQATAPAVTPHYAEPPCNSDEVELEVKDYKTNYTGKVCAPACGDDDSCPTDKPPSQASPKCLLHDSGKKYCALKCFLGCGNAHMTCLRVDATTRVCAYRNHSSPSNGKPCCQGHCADPNQAKYYSIAKDLWGKKHCGECCMEPKKYNLFHHFESNLTKADNDSPCKAFGYTVYDSTDTHGFGPISMTLDLYDLPKESIENAVVVV